MKKKECNTEMERLRRKRKHSDIEKDLDETFGTKGEGVQAPKSNWNYK